MLRTVSHALTAFDDLDRVQQWFDSASPALAATGPLISATPSRVVAPSTASCAKSNAASSPDASNLLLRFGEQPSLLTYVRFPIGNAPVFNRLPNGLLPCGEL